MNSLNTTNKDVWKPDTYSVTPSATTELAASLLGVLTAIWWRDAAALAADALTAAVLMVLSSAERAGQRC